MECFQTTSGEAGVPTSLGVTVEFFRSPWSSVRNPAEKNDSP